MSKVNKGKQLEYDITKHCANSAFGFLMKEPDAYTRYGIHLQNTVDFIGCLSNGIAIYIEAKESEAKSFPIRNIAQHQIDFLTKVASYNALAFIYIHMKSYDSYYLISISDLNKIIASGSKSINKEKLDCFIQTRPENLLEVIYNDMSNLQ